MTTIIADLVNLPDGWFAWVLPHDDRYFATAFREDGEGPGSEGYGDTPNEALQSALKDAGYIS